MSYTPTEWKSGDVITSAKLNKLEQGVAGAGGGGGVVMLHPDTQTGQLDRTFAEIVELAQTGIVCFLIDHDGTCEYYTMICSSVEHGEFNLCTLTFMSGSANMQFACDDESKYPVFYY